MTEGGVTTRYVDADYRVNASTGEAFVYYGFGNLQVAWSGNAFINYLLADHLTSSHGELSSSGSQVGQRRYKPFGSDRAVSGANDLQVDERFTAQRRLDAGGGNSNRELYYYGARWYLPGVGVFSQPDAIVPAPSNPQNLNRYSYVLNNPLRYTDPTGRQMTYDEDEPRDYGLEPSEVTELAPEEGRLEVAGTNERRSEIELWLAAYGNTLELLWNLPNNLLAEIISTFSTGTRRTNLQMEFEEARNDWQVVQVHENVGALGRLLLNLLDTEAITLGSHIFTTEQQIRRSVYQHERGHVTQYDILGPAFLPLYGINQFVADVSTGLSRDPSINAQALNLFEQWAERLAGHLPISLFR